jgi:peptidoglycan/xylan/chitin deacetylase (PgdA/CDA1 family)
MAGIKGIAKRLVPQRLIAWRGPMESGLCALTFDDGPDAEITPLVLDALKDAGVKATFFVVAQKAASLKTLVKRIVDEGHELASHSYTHEPLIGKGIASIRREIEMAEAVLGEFGGNGNGRRRLFRPPYGSVPLSLAVHALRKGITIVLWSKDPEDFRLKTRDEVLNYFAENRVSSGDTILLHDVSRPTVEALPEIISCIRKTGLRPVTVSELLFSAGS